MNEKKQRIIEVSMKLFAKKGFHQTSIQEIAKQSNVSKGAFYLYFDSKEELATSIFDHYRSVVLAKLDAINHKNLTPKEKLAQQIHVFLKMLSEHKEYIIMHFRDNLQLGDQMDEMMIKMNSHGFEWMSGMLREIYGEQIEPYMIDASIQLDGLLQGYCKWLVMHNLEIDSNKLAQFIVRRVDNLIKGMLDAEEDPQVLPEQMTYQAFRVVDQMIDQDKAGQVLAEMTEKVNQLHLAVEQKQQLQEAIELMDSELKKKEPKKIILQGMLTHLRTVPELKKDTEQLKELLLS